MSQNKPKLILTRKRAFLSDGKEMDLFVPLIHAFDCFHTIDLSRHPLIYQITSDSESESEFELNLASALQERALLGYIGNDDPTQPRSEARQHSGPKIGSSAP